MQLGNVIHRKEIDFYNYHAVDILEIVLKDTHITGYLPQKIMQLEEKLRHVCIAHQQEYML